MTPGKMKHITLSNNISTEKALVTNIELQKIFTYIWAYFGIRQKKNDQSCHCATPRNKNISTPKMNANTFDLNHYHNISLATYLK